MARKTAPPSQEKIEERIQQVGRYSRAVRTGLGSQTKQEFGGFDRLDHAEELGPLFEEIRAK